MRITDLDDESSQAFHVQCWQRVDQRRAVLRSDQPQLVLLAVGDDEEAARGVQRDRVGVVVHGGRHPQDIVAARLVGDVGSCVG